MTAKSNRDDKAGVIRPRNVNLWRAGCSESCTSGSEGGRRKSTYGDVGNSPAAYPTTSTRVLPQRTPSANASSRASRMPSSRSGPALFGSMPPMAANWAVGCARPMSPPNAAPPSSVSSQPVPTPTGFIDTVLTAASSSCAADSRSARPRTRHPSPARLSCSSHPRRKAIFSQRYTQHGNSP